MPSFFLAAKWIIAHVYLFSRFDNLSLAFLYVGSLSYTYICIYNNICICLVSLWIHFAISVFTPSSRSEGEGERWEGERENINNDLKTLNKLCWKGIFKDCEERRGGRGREAEGMREGGLSLFFVSSLASWWIMALTPVFFFFHTHAHTHMDII